MLMNKLAGSPVQDKPQDRASFAAILDALKANRNLPLTMALVQRFGELEERAAKSHSPLTKSAFGSGASLTNPEQQAIGAMSGQILPPAFIANVPRLVSR
jgi:hypothetical protein